MASRQESDSWKGRYDCARQSSDCHPCDLLWVGLVWALSTLGDHVWFEEGSFNDEVVVEHCLHDGTEHFLRNFGTSFDGVGSVSKNLWLDDWHEAIILADRTVAGQGMGSLIDGKLTWESIADFKDCSPFGKSASLIIECLSSCSKPIKSLSCILAISSSEYNKSLIELDSRMDASFF